ncbi:MAG: hypothetical protein AB9866_10895 [Syntrophobacteraceae bacterium]
MAREKKRMKPEAPGGAGMSFQTKLGGQYGRDEAGNEVLLHRTEQARFDVKPKEPEKGLINADS